MRLFPRLFPVFAFFIGVTLSANADSIEAFAQRVGALVNPAKLATLRERGANPRVQKYVVQLFQAKAAGWDPSKVATLAVAQVGMQGEAAKLTVETMLRNLRIAQQMGCLGADGVAQMRRGNAATIQTGPYRGDELSVDHIIPMHVVPELDKVIANLELLPLRQNEAKKIRVGQRQLDLAQRLAKAGLLSQSGLRAVELRAGFH